MKIKQLLLLTAFVSVPAQVAAAAESLAVKKARVKAYHEKYRSAIARDLFYKADAITRLENRIAELSYRSFGHETPELKLARQELKMLRDEFDIGYAKLRKKFTATSLSEGQRAQIAEIKAHLAWIKEEELSDVRSMFVENVENNIKKLLEPKKLTREELDKAWSVLTSSHAMYGYMGIHDTGRVPKKEIRALLAQTDELLALQKDLYEQSAQTRDLDVAKEITKRFDLESLEANRKEFAALEGKFTRLYQPDEEDEQLLESFRERHAQLSDTIEKQKKMILRVYTLDSSRLDDSYKKRLMEVEGKKKIINPGKLKEVRRIITRYFDRIIVPLADLQLRGLTEKQQKMLKKIVDRYLTMVQAFMKFQAKREDVSLQGIDSLIKLLEENLNRKISFFRQRGPFEKTLKRLRSITKAEATLKKKKERLLSAERKIQQQIDTFLEAAKEGSGKTSQAILAFKNQLYKDGVSKQSLKYQQLSAIAIYSELKRLEKKKLIELAENEKQEFVQAIGAVFHVLGSFSRGELSRNEFKTNLHNNWEAYKESFPLEGKYQSIDKKVQKLLREKATRPAAPSPAAQPEAATVTTTTTITTTAEVAADQNKNAFISELSSIEKAFEAGLGNTGSVQDAKAFTNATVRDDLAALHDRYNEDGRYDEIENAFKARIRSALEDHIASLPAQ